MPRYLYKCNSCQEEVELKKSMNDPHFKDCPICHKENTLEHILRSGSFQLRGGGWFSQGYAGGGPIIPNGGNDA
jgi:putative FmdB family regulatory protein